jgi:diguanylate cyclase (GGDEF)-like protein/PAS domain S-box-containing protein
LKNICFYSVLLIILLVGFPDWAWSTTPTTVGKETQHVLVLLSYHHGHSWEDDILRGFEAWDGAQAERPVFHIEWMDTKRYASAEYRRRYQQFLEEKYAGRRFDLIATVDDIALDHAVKAASWRDVPIVFSGINGDPLAIIGNRGRATGIAERFNVGNTLRLALSLHPDARQFVFITADDESGAGNRQNIDANLAGLSPEIRRRLVVEHWTPSSLDQIDARLAGLSADAVVFALGSIPKYAGGSHLGNEQLVAHVRTKKRGAVYSDTDRSVGQGAVGGYVNSGFENGRLMARMARRILASEPPESLPVVYETPQALLIDFIELKRLGVSDARLPAEAKVLNRPPSLFDPERRATLNGLIAGALLLILLLGGLVMRARSKILRIQRESVRELQAANEALMRAKSAEALILGGPVERVHAEIAALCSNNMVRLDEAGRENRGSILDEVALTRAKLLQLDTERRHAEDALLCTQKFVSSILDSLTDHICVLDRKGVILAVNRAWRVFRDLNHPQPGSWQDDIGINYLTFCTRVSGPGAEDAQLMAAGIRGVANGDMDEYKLEYPCHSPDEDRWFFARVTRFHDSSGNILIAHTNITERKRNEEELRLSAKVFEHSGEAIIITDADNRIVRVNAAFTRITGYMLDDVLGENPRVLSAHRTPPETYRAMWSALNTFGYWQGELWDRAKDGHVYPKWVSVTLLRNAAGEVTHHVASFVDVSERKAFEEHISRLAHHDPLTGLFNRFSLNQRLEQAILTARRQGDEVVVMLIDMDRFKSINDTLGHQAGDMLLIEIAHRIQAVVRVSDIAARLGGDEFVVVLTGVASGMLTGASIAGKIRDQLGQPYAYMDKQLHTTPSIGLSIFPADGGNSETLLKHADLAMYAAKAQGKNTFQFFNPAMNQGVIERMQIEQELRAALKRKEFELHYQPQVFAEDGRVSGLEALVRWRHPHMGMISPMKFIPVAEEIGLIEELGAWVLNEACRQLAAWKAVGVSAKRMAVNLSAYQLRSPNLVELVRTTMSRYEIGEGELELEVTESVAMEDPQQAITQLAALRALGVELAIDDFGTGYSSLAYLKLLPVQTLKLDRAFVQDIEVNEDDATISLATISLAHSLGLKVVAEGVETETQRSFLASHGCDILQGYLFSKPLAAEEAALFIQRS